MGLVFHRCRWVRDRLPLLAGGELTGPDRRQVERHLIACAGCRDLGRSLSESLAVLRDASTLAAPSPEPLSLWPALQLQIREAKHMARAEARTLPASPTWDDALALFAGRRFRATAALVVVLGGVVGVSGAVGVWARRQVVAARSRESVAARPIRIRSGFAVAPLAPVPEPSLLTTIARSDPAPADPVRLPPRFDYDLDRGTPMGDGGDVKASY